MGKNEEERGRNRRDGLAEGIFSPYPFHSVVPRLKKIVPSVQYTRFRFFIDNHFKQLKNFLKKMAQMSFFCLTNRPV